MTGAYDPSTIYTVAMGNAALRLAGKCKAILQNDMKTKPSAFGKNEPLVKYLNYDIWDAGWGPRKKEKKSSCAIPEPSIFDVPDIVEVVPAMPEMNQETAPEPDVPDNTPAISISKITSFMDTKPTRISTTWGAFVNACRVPDVRGALPLDQYLLADKSVRDSQKDGAAIIAGTYSEPNTRNQDALEALSLVTLDLDDGQHTFDAVCDLLEGFEAVVFTSYSHSPSKPKYRAYILLQKVITGEIKPALERIMDFFDDRIGGIDSACRKPGQLFFTPACPPDGDILFQFRHLSGVPLDPDDFPAPPAKEQIRLERTTESGTGKPGDDYNARASYHDLLLSLGWSHFYRNHYSRPGKTRGVSGSILDAGFYVHSSAPETMLELGKSYTLFGLYAAGYHNGDHQAAARELGRLGYGDQERTPPPKPPQASPVYEPIPPAGVEPYEPPKPLFMSFADMMSETIRIKKLIGKVIQRGCTCQLFGPSGDGKTFVALGMSLAVATGGVWNGNQCEKGLVIYFNGEGREGFKLRCRAWQKHHGITGQVDFHSSRSAIEFNDSGLRQVRAEVKALEEQTGQKVALIVIDTLARHLIGDENSTQHMSEFIKQVDGLRDTFPDSTALIVHHTGNNAEATGRSRGSSALKAAVDVEIQCMKFELTFTKMKDSAPPAPVGFKFKVIDLGFDDDGEPITSCVLEYGEMSTRNKQPVILKTTPAERNILGIISGTPGITIDAVRAEYCQRALSIVPDTKMNSLYTSFRRAMEGLTDKNLAYIDGASIFSGQRTVSGHLSSMSTHTSGQDRTPPLKGVTVVQYAGGQEQDFDLPFTDDDFRGLQI